MREWARVASPGKRKTAIAKLNRERRLLERRAEKQAKKAARKTAAREEGEAATPPASEAVDSQPGDAPA